MRILGSLLSKLAGNESNESSSSIGNKDLAPLGITAAASTIDAGIQKKRHGSGTTTLLKGVTETIKNEIKNKKEDF